MSVQCRPGQAGQDRHGPDTGSAGPALSAGHHPDELLVAPLAGKDLDIQWMSRSLLAGSQVKRDLTKQPDRRAARRGEPQSLRNAGMTPRIRRRPVPGARAGVRSPAGQARPCAATSGTGTQWASSTLQRVGVVPGGAATDRRRGDT